jgi:rod shape-determining protein MreC
MYRRPGRGRVLLVLCLALSIGLITLDFRQGSAGFLGSIKDVAVAVVAPVQRGVSTVTQPVGDFFVSLGDLARIRSHNRELQDEVQRLRAEQAEAQSLLDENERLREFNELGRSWPTMRRATAAVFSKVPANYQWAVFIDKGRADRVRRNMAVIDPEGLVGKVIQADRDHATVLLLIDPEATAGARIRDVRDTGAVGGTGANETLSFEFGRDVAAVDGGDEVVTSGYDGGIFPPGIPIGRVTEVGSPTASLERQIEVDANVDFAALDFVSVLLDTGPAFGDRPRPAARG